MTFLFDLDDPGSFPAVDVLSDERVVIERFIQTARNLASYSVINSRDGSIWSSENGEWSIEENLPNHESFSGTSATFRQLHNDQEKASYIAVRGVLNKAIGRLDDDTVSELRSTLKVWSKARTALTRTMASTLIFEKLMLGAPESAPRSLQGIVPDDLIKIYNYGESIHWGEQKSALADLENDMYNQNFHKHCFLKAISSLSHFYFGFAVLLEAALASDAV